MNGYEAKQARRKQRLLEAAEKQDAKADAAYKASDTVSYTHLTLPTIA